MSSETTALIESMTRSSGTSDRTYKSGIIWAIAENDAQLIEEARKVLAWQAIRSGRLRKTRR